LPWRDLLRLEKPEWQPDCTAMTPRKLIMINNPLIDRDTRPDVADIARAQGDLIQVKPAPAPGAMI